MSYFRTGSQHGASHWPKPHHGLVSEYQASGIPYLTGSSGAQTNEKVEFPYVTRWIVVSAHGGATKIGFSSTGITNDQHITIPSGEISPRLELKCTDIWVTSAGGFNLVAGLTNVTGSNFPDISTLEGIVGA
jgi:hypothetical protein